MWSALNVRQFSPLRCARLTVRCAPRSCPHGRVQHLLSAASVLSPAPRLALFTRVPQDRPSAQHEAAATDPGDEEAFPLAASAPASSASRCVTQVPLVLAAATRGAYESSPVAHWSPSERGRAASHRGGFNAPGANRGPACGAARV